MVQVNRFANVIGADATIKEALEVINETVSRACVILDESNKVVGTLTDGDVRRQILRDSNLTGVLVSEIMNSKPLVITDGIGMESVSKLMADFKLKMLPVVNHLGELVNVIGGESTAINGPLKTIDTAVIMAGGEGRRLRPLTDDVPKPLLSVGSRSIIEHIIDKFAQTGIKKIFISVNYLADMFVNRLQDGGSYGVEIIYLREDTPMGTAGSLKLLESFSLHSPFFVVNGDVLTDVSFAAMETFHFDCDAELSVGAVTHEYEIPFGVIKTSGERLLEIREKPVHSVLCNAGTYLVSPSALSVLTQSSGHLGFDEFIALCLENGKRVCAFPIHERWSDLGSHEALAQAKKELVDG